MNKQISYLTINDFEPGILRERIILELRYNNFDINKSTFAQYLKEISKSLGMNSHPELPEPIITSANGHTSETHNGLEAMMFRLESGLHAYLWENCKLLTVDMNSCKPLDEQIVWM